MREDEGAGVGWDGMASTETAATVTGAADIKKDTADFKLAKTDLRGAQYDIIRKNRQKFHKIGNFVLGHRTSVGSQGLQRQVIKLVSDIRWT